MNYLDYNIEDWVVDEDFIAYVNGAASEEIDRLKSDPEHSQNIDKAAQIVKRLGQTAPALNTENLDRIYKQVNKTIDQKSTKGNQRPRAKIIQMKWVSFVAAAVAVLVIALPFFLASKGEHITSVAEQETFKLPDSSTVKLNSVSSIKYNKKTWKKNRYLVLEGEAFFSVEKGSNFMVKSSQGIVAVLGTKFNVRDRIGVYEVECIEGKVRVNLESGNTFTLSKGDRLRQVDGKQAVVEKNVVQKIDWINKYVEVENEKLSHVLDEVARHFDVKFVNKDRIEEQRYKGFFSTVSLDSALQQILWPMDVEYEINDDKVIIK